MTYSQLNPLISSVSHSSLVANAVSSKISVSINPVLPPNSLLNCHRSQPHSISMVSFQDPSRAIAAINYLGSYCTGYCTSAVSLILSSSLTPRSPTPKMVTASISAHTASSQASIYQISYHIHLQELTDRTLRSLRSE